MDELQRIGGAMTLFIYLSSVGKVWWGRCGRFNRRLYVPEFTSRATTNSGRTHGFQHPIQVVQLLGTGNKPGKLIRYIRERPFSVLLFNVMNEGIFVGNNGRITDFHNVILMMMSNLGTQQSKGITFVTTEAKHDVSGPIRHFFRPEFYNRF